MKWWTNSKKRYRTFRGYGHSQFTSIMYGIPWGLIYVMWFLGGVSGWWLGSHLNLQPLYPCCCY